MDITVIICTWNRSKALAGVLTSLEASVVPAGIDWEVLVVDNNSSDDTRAICELFIEKTPRRFRYLFEGKQGKTNALNAGIEQAEGELLALTDDDVTVDPHWVAAIYDAFREFDCAAIGGRIVPVWNCQKPSWVSLDGPFHHTGYGGIVHFDKGDSPSVLSKTTVVGANMALRKSVVEKYGPYRSDLNRINDLLGGEDTEYCWRLLRAGERVVYVPQAVVYHPVEAYRTTRKYIQSFAFHYGRWTVRVGEIPEGTKRYFGVPRYLFPIALKRWGRWMASIGTKRRFFNKLELCHTLGQMVESKRWTKSRQAPTPIGRFDPVK